MPSARIFCLAAWALMQSAGFAAAADERPNILFIMSDDHAAHALSAYGSKVNKTPQLDRIAREGVRFTHCFVTNSICTPSRAAILTGKYSHVNGVTVFNAFDGRQPTFPKLFRAAGYQTAVIGKWHLFSDPTGFDYWNVLPGQGLYHDPVMIEMGKEKKHEGYATDLITDFSIDWLEKRDRSKPFLLLSHHKAPHREWSPSPAHASLYEDEDLPLPETFDDDYRGRSRAAAEATMRIERDFTRTDLKRDPPPGLTPAELKRWNYQRYMKDYLRCVASIDDNVGRLLDYLESSGLARNTVVVYTSDQGFFLGDHGWYDKRFMYEESLRMPLLIRFPPLIAAGRVEDSMVLNVDFAPTLLELAGIAIPADMQGRSFLPLLKGEKPADWRTSMYYRYYHYPEHHRVQPHYGVRTRRHKLIYFDRLDEWELFDLEKDPREMRNVHAEPEYAPVVAELERELARLRAELEDDDSYLGPADAPLDKLPLELVLRWEFDDGEEGRALDASGKGHHGIIVEGRRVPGRRGLALQLEGNGRVEIQRPPASLAPQRKALAAGAWCRPEAAQGVLVSHGGASHGFSLYLEGGTPHFAVRRAGTLFVVRAPEPAAPGEWLHLAGAIGEGGELQLFVGGKLAATSRAGAIHERPIEGFTVGADPGSAVGSYAAPSAWKGAIDDLRCYWGQLDETTLREWAGN
jgi:arylsulfatase A-like enzyme